MQMAGCAHPFHVDLKQKGMMNHEFYLNSVKKDSNIGYMNEYTIHQTFYPVKNLHKRFYL